jgi:hypothetical protein
MVDIVGVMNNTDTTRCTLFADVYTSGDGQFVRTLKVSRLFGDAVSTEEASDILEEALHLKFEGMIQDDPGGLDPDLHDQRLRWD